MITVAVAIGVYVGQVGVVAVRLQNTRAAAQVGAATVLHVEVPGDVSFVGVVRRADPSGRSAMAVDELTGAGDRPGSWRSTPGVWRP
ncbi:hypothetical protein GCM10025867_01250 [Frondihabitans sucicola]|uniref:Uncharacterized protein n=1 Tax=Frondihabitans sucicola TaxID=1268041 RepID=A0ABM8GHN0_9MICO|nr:hypothetical protein [Frondihabitans sucicola]BDZ47884.1 hypothetical protein GCM10025867_01250 [Frondihabitans sucicola]